MNLKSVVVSALTTLAVYAILRKVAPDMLIKVGL